MRAPQYLFDRMVEQHRIWQLDPARGVRADFTGLTLQDIKAVNYNLAGAIFKDTALFSCNFSHADLTDISADCICCHATNFTEATFKNAHLSRAEFIETIFWETDLWNVSGDGTYIISLQLGGEHVCYTSEFLQVNCQQFDIKKIWWMTDEDVIAQAQKGNTHEMAELAVWWQKWKSQIYHIVTNHPATPVNIAK